MGAVGGGDPVHVSTIPDAPPGEKFSAVVATHVVDLAPAGGGNAKGLAEGLILFWGGVVRDARESPRGQVEDKGVGYAEALRDEEIAAERIKRGGSGALALYGPDPSS